MARIEKRDMSATTRHVTLLRVKRAGASGFVFTGWATTPAEDLVGDIVEPRGSIYELPLPLLWMHDHAQPVGVVESATVTERGIRVSFRLLPEVEKTKEAVALIEAGALALSIGFIPLDSEPLRTGGRRYTSWRWTELSIVSVAANPGAKIGKSVVVSEQRKATELPPPSGDLPDPKLFGFVMGSAIREAISPLVKRIDALEAANARLREEMERKAWRYRGYWAEGMECRMGEFVTDQGSLWVCLTDTREKPSYNSTAWRIAARKGKDGK